MNIRCSAHRLLPWLGHGECSSCGALFKHLLEAPEACPNCNARLQPWAKHRRVEELFKALEGARVTFWGRPTCAKCWEGKVSVEAREAASEG